MEHPNTDLLGIWSESDEDETITSLQEPEDPDQQDPQMIRLQNLLRDMVYPEGKLPDGRASFAPYGQSPNSRYLSLLHIALKTNGYKKEDTKGRRTRDYVFTTQQLPKVKQLIKDFMVNVPIVNARGPNKKKASEYPIQILVRNMFGKLLTLKVNVNDTVEHLKLKIQNKGGGIREEQRLTCETRQLEDNRTLSDYNIQEGSTVKELGRLRGGARNAADVPDPPQDSSLCLIDADALTTTMTR